MSIPIQKNITTKSGNTLQLFYNPENNLVVVDLVDKNGMGGKELYRGELDEKEMLSHVRHNRRHVLDK